MSKPKPSTLEARIKRASEKDALAQLEAASKTNAHLLSQLEDERRRVETLTERGKAQERDLLDARQQAAEARKLLTDYQESLRRAQTEITTYRSAVSAQAAIIAEELG